MIVRNIRHRYNLDQFEDQAVSEILKPVEQARQEIIAELDDIYGELTWTDERNMQLLDELDRLTVGIKDRLGEDVSEVARISYEQSIEAHNSIMSIGGRAANVFAVQLSAEQIQSFLATPMGGMQLSEWVQRTFDYPLQERLGQELGAGLFRGESYRKLSKRVDELLGDAADNTDTLVRSWVQSANVNAQQVVAAANEDILKGWRWDATLENGNLSNGHGTCLRCLSLSAREEVHPLNGGPSIPLHPNCRCIRQYVTKSYRELGIPLDDLDDAVRPYTVRGKVDPLTGEIKRGKTGTGGQPLLEAGRIDGGMDVFFRQLPEQLQRQTLGPGRYNLWQQGKIKLGDLADEYGNQLTIAQLASDGRLTRVGRADLSKYTKQEIDFVKEAAKWDDVEDFINSPNHYFRFSDYETGTRGEVPYQMFSDDPYRVEGYGEYKLITNAKRSVDSEDLEGDAEKALKNRRDLLDEYQATAEDLAKEISPEDIVDAAGVWDAPEVAQAIVEDVVEPKNIAKIRTPDGMVVFDYDEILPEKRLLEIWEDVHGVKIMDDAENVEDVAKKTVAGDPVGYFKLKRDLESKYGEDLYLKATDSEIEKLERLEREHYTQ
jgi:hypothetical protein